MRQRAPVFSPYEPGRNKALVLQEAILTGLSVSQPHLAQEDTMDKKSEGKNDVPKAEEPYTFLPSDSFIPPPLDDPTLFLNDSGWSDLILL